MPTPYKYRGIPPYVDAVAAEMGDREAGAKARLLGPLNHLSPLVSQAAEHLKRRTPEGVQAAERSLWHARRSLKSLEIAREAGNRILAEIDAHVIAVKGELGIPVAVADDPPTPRRRGRPRRTLKLDEFDEIAPDILRDIGIPVPEAPTDASDDPESETVDTPDETDAQAQAEADETEAEDGGLI